MIVSMSAFTLRPRPKAYKAKDAPYRVGGNAGYYIASRPKTYPKTPQQRAIKELAKMCGIKSGVSKSALMTAMKDCVTTENYKKARSAA